MASKPWKYEADCARMDALIDETVIESKRPGWGRGAKKVLFALRAARSRATPLALHFLSISATEMLSGRHEASKLCMLTGMALARKALLSKFMSLFVQVFAVPSSTDEAAAAEMPAEFVQAIGQALADMSSKLVQVPDGVTNVEIIPGLMATVTKHSLAPGKAKGGMAMSAGDGDPRWN